MNVEAKQAQPTLDRLRENKKLRQTIQNTANAQLLKLSIPTTSVVVIKDIYLLILLKDQCDHCCRLNKEQDQSFFPRPP